MENNLEIKARFFAQYWGQKVMVDQKIDKRLFPVNTGNIEYKISDPYLELTPISDITDEDALWLGRDANEFVSSYEDDLKYCKELVERMSNKPHLINQKQGDYLRSKGYALHYMGLSVEKLIEYGWVKLKTLNQ